MWRSELELLKTWPIFDYMLEACHVFGGREIISVLMPTEEVRIMNGCEMNG